MTLLRGDVLPNTTAKSVLRERIYSSALDCFMLVYCMHGHYSLLTSTPSLLSLLTPHPPAFHQSPLHYPLLLLPIPFPYSPLTSTPPTPSASIPPMCPTQPGSIIVDQIQIIKRFWVNLFTDKRYLRSDIINLNGYLYCHKLYKLFL